MTGPNPRPEAFAHVDAGATTSDAELRAFEASAAADLQLPLEAHVIGEPVTVTKIRYAGVPRIGLLATCHRDDRVDAKEREAAGDYAGAQEHLTSVLALDQRCFEAHAHLGDHEFRHWPSLALRHYELGVAIGSLTVGADFDGVLPRGLPDNRPFLHCLHGMGRALFRLDERDAAAEVFRRLLRLDPADHLLARARASQPWRPARRGANGGGGPRSLNA